MARPHDPLAPYPWTYFETRWTSVPREALSNSERANSCPLGLESFKARFIDADYRKAEALDLIGETDSFQRVKTFLARGRLDEARVRLDFLAAADSGEAGDENKIEILLEKARLAAFEGEWENCVELCNRAYQLDRPSGISQLTLLQVRSLAYFELGLYSQSRRDLQLIDSLAELFPQSPILSYARVLGIKLCHREGQASLARRQLEGLWKDLIETRSLNSDTLLTCLRAEIDFRSQERLPFGAHALASLLVAEAMGDRLYAALARTDVLRSEISTERLRNRIFRSVQQDAIEYARVRRTLDGLPPRQSPGRDESSFGEEHLETDVLLFQAIGILVKIRPFSFSVLNPQDRIPQLLLSLSAGACSKEALLKDVWKISRYVPHLHENVVDQAISRTRKKFGVTIVVQKGKANLECCLVVP